MPTEEHTSQDIFHLGQEVFDSEGNKIGKVQARFERYILVENGGFFGRTYYIPHTRISKSAGDAVNLSLSEAELR